MDLTLVTDRVSIFIDLKKDAVQHKLGIMFRPYLKLDTLLRKKLLIYTTSPNL
jgi:hypothetical protein